jgi:hypothetical protein
MNNLEVYQGFCTATCKNCGKAFMYYDKKGEYNDTPPTKFYCEECVKRGFKNEKFVDTPNKFLKRNKITDKTVIREFKKICKTRKNRRTYENILKEAIEVAGYYKEEEN